MPRRCSEGSSSSGTKDAGMRECWAGAGYLHSDCRSCREQEDWIQMHLKSFFKAINTVCIDPNKTTLNS